ncbi:MAG: putative HTH-type transcriptional regulator [Calditrichaeota bacterium]|nr:putative HTH-type transcriptional regulator [Calditrichota bacterium]
MAFSKSWGYAVRALVHLAGAEHAEKRWQSGELAEATGLPASYLSKVLSPLTAAGILDSARGRGGGVRLAKPAAEIRLSDVAAATEGLPAEEPSADAMDGAPAHLVAVLAERWRPYRRGLLEYLTGTTVADLLDGGS